MATSNIAYRINYSDQGRRGKAGSVDNFFVIAPLQTNAYQPAQFDAAGNQVAPKDLSLVFTGYRNPVYGEALWTNMLQLLENFASPTPPLHPQLGQLWFDKSSTLGILKLCTDPIGPAPATAAAPNPTWTKVNNRIIVSTTSPIPSLASVLDPTLWYNPDNRGLFFWDPAATAVNTASSPYTTLDPTGPTDASGFPMLHPPIGIPNGPKWVNVLYHRYASTTEYNTFANQFAAWDLPTPRPTALPNNQQPTDAQWIALMQYVRNYAANTPSLGVDASTLVDTTFKYYSTDRYGFGLLQMYYDNLVAVTNKIYAALAAIRNPIPVAAFTTSATTGAIPMTVTLADNSVNTSGGTYNWNFGDGTTSSTAGSVSHTYAAVGTYNITLTVTTANGTSSAVHSIQAFRAPIASFTRTPASGTTPLSVSFTDTSLFSPTSWSWNFGDGTTSTQQNPTHTYVTAGTYTVTLTTANAAGSSSSTSTVAASTPVIMIPPVASFSRSVSSGTTPLAVTFTDTSTNTPTSWAWNFGDGATATTQNATHTYTTPGTYTVTHTATNSAGSNTTSSTIIATVPAVVPSFTKSPSAGTAPLTVAFTDTSSNSPTTWQWDFGDGTTSTQQNPSHTYTTAGTYTVTLNALNATGGSTVTSTITVSRNTVTITVVSSIQNFNAYNNRISSQHGSAVTVSGTYVPGSTDVLVTINSNVAVTSTSTSWSAFDLGVGWADADFIAVGVSPGAYIVGKGGQGGGFGATGTTGLPGGNAFRATRAVTIDNYGTIGGGGGGGGKGSSGDGQDWAGGGGGGAGFGAGGQGARTAYGGGDGAAGTLTAGGGGGAGSTAGGYGNDRFGAYGGAGGALGAAGAAGGQVGAANQYIPGGAAGQATQGNSFITWNTTGTRLGILG